MPKILKPYTIIPPDLYVQRDADKQVKNIIADMGRPGYVLVSRQMGKTNLLLNAKRKLESIEDAFVYIDLSNSFNDAKSCFENIIDIALETFPDKFEEVSRTITERRRELSNTPPHKQHTNELRLLLKALKGGKIVIILDEIDALTKTNYSDQIFSQIRSSYFASRINYPEFNNLTYLLSGVVEPGEIIKDPKVSPFNIGQKIYLNDFSKIEFEHFISISKLPLAKELIDRIFYWANGNPRISWDICSEVENELKKGNVTIDVIDKIVNEIYLVTFDKPPIDNIRDLVKKDREIRNSIIEITSDKGREISDRIKSKLYLAGIINYDENDIHIKNRIIEQCLSLDWINSIEEDERGLVRIAIELFEKEKYEESLGTFERYLTDNLFSKEEQSICYYYMAYASYRNSNFEKAIDYLSNTLFEIEEDRKWYFRNINLKGLSYYYLNRIEESLECFKIIIDNSNKDELYARALLNFGSISLKTEKSDHKEDAITIFNEIINENGFEKEKLKTPFINELKSIAHYNLAQIQSTTNEISEANRNFNLAITYANDNTKPTIILALLEISSSEIERYNLLEQIVNLIIEGKIEPVEIDPDKPIDFTFNEFRSILIETFINFKDTLFLQLKPFLKILGDKSIAAHIFDLAMFSIINNNWKNAVKLLDEIYDNFNNHSFGIDNELIYKTTKYIAYFTNIRDSIDKHIEYLALFSKERFAVVDYIDMEIFTNLIYNLTTRKKYLEALKYVNIITSIKDVVPEENLINYLVIYNLELNLYFYTNNRTKAIEKAHEIIKLADSEIIKKQNSNLLGETGLEVIKQNANDLLYPTIKKREPITTGKRYGRNDNLKVRYKDGTTIETKFKKIEKDLLSGECFILN